MMTKVKQKSNVIEFVIPEDEDEVTEDEGEEPTTVDEIYQANLKDRLDGAECLPRPPLSYAMTLCYRNCRYFEHRSLVKPVMRILARAIWVDEEHASHLDDNARARVLAAFDAIWDADEQDDDDLPLYVAKLREVVNAVTAEAGFQNDDFRKEDRVRNEGVMNQ